MTKWIYNGNTLHYSAMAIENPETEFQNNENKQKELHVNFLCIGFVHKIAITGGEDGIVIAL